MEEELKGQALEMFSCANPSGTLEAAGVEVFPGDPFSFLPGHQHPDFSGSSVTQPFSDSCVLR